MYCRAKLIPKFNCKLKFFTNKIRVDLKGLQKSKEQSKEKCFQLFLTKCILRYAFGC